MKPGNNGKGKRPVPLHKLTCYLASPEYEALRARAFAERVSQSEIVRRALLEHLRLQVQGKARHDSMEEGG